MDLVTIVQGHDSSDQYLGNSEGSKDSLHLVSLQGVTSLLEVNEDHDCPIIFVHPASLNHSSDELLTRAMRPKATLIDP